MNLTCVRGFETAFDYTYPTNSLSALKPEWWALEGLAVLEEELVVANLVNRDYDNYFVNAGDTVNISKAGTFVPKQKLVGKDTNVQTASSTGTSVKLNQHIEVTFSVDDRELQQSIPDLRQYFLVPAIRAIAVGVDRACVGETVQFINNATGQLGVALTDNAVIDLAKVFDTNLVPQDNRNLIIGPSAKADMMRLARFTDAEKRGGESLLYNGQIGHIMGFDVFMSQTVGKQLGVYGHIDTELGNLAAAYPAGTKSMTVDGTRADTSEGHFCTIEGVPGIYVVDTGTTGQTFKVKQGLKGAAASGADVKVWDCDATAEADGTDYPNTAGSTYLRVGNMEDAQLPAVGQGIAALVAYDSVNGYPVHTGHVSSIYTVVSVTELAGDDVVLELNRPLEATVSDGVRVVPLPSGGAYNLAFRPDAITLVNRPLAPAFAGVAATVQNNGSLALRVTIGYDQRKMVHIITVDTLLGVKVLDVDQGGVLLN